MHEPSSSTPSLLPLFVAVYNTPACQVIGRELDRNAVSGQDADKILPHFSRNVGEDLMLVFELHAEHRVGKRLNHGGHHFDGIFFAASLARVLFLLQWPSRHTLLS